MKLFEEYYIFVNYCGKINVLMFNFVGIVYMVN